MRKNDDNKASRAAGGKVFGTLQVLGSDGQDYICKCLKCGYQDRYNKYNLENGSIKYCRRCKKFNGIELGKVNKRGLKVAGYKAGNDGDILVLAFCTRCKNERYMTKTEFKDGAGCKACSIQSRSGFVDEEDNKRADSGKMLTKAQAKEQANGQDGKTERERDKERAAEEKKVESRFEKAGLLNRDYVGQVFMGMEVLEQTVIKGRMMSKLRCCYCRAIKIVPLVDVIRNTITCDECGDRPYRFECPKCNGFLSRQTYMLGGVLKENNSFSITRRELYGGGKLVCPKCNKTINLVEEANKEDLVQTQRILLENMDTEKYGSYKQINQATSLAMSSEIAYVGRDGKPRFNCLCLKHKRTLSLRADEMQAYTHEQCDNPYMKAVPLMKKKEEKKKKSIGEDDQFYY